MNKFAALALTAAAGLAAMGYAKPAEARVYVGIGVPGVALVAPSGYGYPPDVGVYGPYYRGHPYLYRPGFVRYGFHGYAYGRRWR